MQSVPYMNAVGALMYLAIGTCPDIAYAVGVRGRPVFRSEAVLEFYQLRPWTPSAFLGL